MVKYLVVFEGFDAMGANMGSGNSLVTADLPLSGDDIRKFEADTCERYGYTKTVVTNIVKLER